MRVHAVHIFLLMNEKRLALAYAGVGRFVCRACLRGFTANW